MPTRFIDAAGELVVGAIVWAPLLAFSWLLAQVPDMPRGSWPDFGNITATAILGWYAWHTASKTIPNLVNDFRAESKEMRETFKAEMKEARAEFHAWLKELKDDD
jgi:hypothetical protein